MKHLTDNQIQTWLDRDGVLPLLAQSHLEGCESCRMQVEVYASLYEELNQDELVIPQGFADKVYGEISQPVKRFQWARNPENWGLALAGGFGLFCLGYWMPWTRLFSGFHLEIPAPALPKVFPSFSIELPIIAMIPAVIGLFALADAKWVKPRLNM